MEKSNSSPTVLSLFPHLTGKPGQAMSPPLLSGIVLKHITSHHLSSWEHQASQCSLNGKANLVSLLGDTQESGLAHDMLMRARGILELFSLSVKAGF